MIDRGIFDREDSRLRVGSALRKAVQTVLIKDIPTNPRLTVEIGCGSGFSTDIYLRLKSEEVM